MTWPTRLRVSHVGPGLRRRLRERWKIIAVSMQHGRHGFRDVDPIRMNACGWFDYVCIWASMVVMGSSDAAVIPEKSGLDISERKKTDIDSPGEIIGSA